MHNSNVIILHGLLRSKFSMASISKRLIREGYTVFNLDYRTRAYSIEDHAHRLKEILDSLSLVGDINFVTHSLGGIVVRQYLNNIQHLPVKRVVMLAPPNHGSEIADKLRENPLFRIIFGYPGQQLGTGEKSVPENLGPIEVETGIIAGTASFKLFTKGLFDGPNDGTVSVRSAVLEGMTDFAAVPYDHSLIMYYRDVQDLIVKFLKTGSFHS